MRQKLGWSLATLAILTFSLGQGTATAGQVLTSTTAPPTVKATTPVKATATVKATAAPSAKATSKVVKPTFKVIKPHTMSGKPPAPKKAPVVKPGVKATGRAALNAPFSATDPTKVPHYFGPYSNWANTPQTQPNAVVTIGGVTSGGGTGATADATVDPKTGGVSGYTITDPGSGYTSAPDVAVTSPGVPGAIGAHATAVIGTGVLTDITVYRAGFGYKTPQVSFTGGGTPTTPATAVASGGVDSLTLTGGGNGYQFEPTVQFSLPDAPYCTTVPAPVPACQAPTAIATKNSSNVVDSIELTGLGTGYLSPPTITIRDGNVLATFPATATGTINVDRIDITNGGLGYASAPAVQITDTTGTGSGATATATVAAAGAVRAINVVDKGTGYLTAGLKKFVDTLSGFGPDNHNNLNNYVPVAVPDTTTYPGSDYYEIAVVQFRQKFATGLPATLVRGYVQLSTTAVPGAHVQLTNANLDPTLPNTDIAGRFGVDKPYYLGPTIVANKNRPVRVLFRNLLPTGVAGNLFLPVDTASMGAGFGPAGVTLGAGNVPMMAPGNGTVTDAVRNPACGETPKPVTCYTENRATIHLHGGVTPWISDGTPHQWSTPAGETGDYPKGVSVSNVPDMPDPGAGAQTFFYTNQQSARLMFYHDHAWGITRLNVYAGEAAGYLVNDATEAALTAPGGALAGLGSGTPLMIQDKTFVPADVTRTDPTWNSAKWGGTGNLWTPHVYMPYANPSSPSGTNPFGRWIYGPWFWPPATGAAYPPIANPWYNPACDPEVTTFCEPPQIPGTPNSSQTMESFQDTPVINGTAYPTTNVDPKAYRFRVLNAGNDRFWNLSWYVADPSTGTQSEVALNPEEVAAAQSDPNIFPTPDTAKSPKGPDWIQVANEGGFLPAPAIIPPQPITWITDPTRFDFGNVDKHSLLVAPAERADVVVDFSQYRGKTLILYNDAPAAFPARQANEDFYTGDPDNTGSGGAPSTLPGYGPNTRTIMQVKVSAATSAAPFDLAKLNTAFAHHSDGTGVFESSQDPTIVGQAAYNSAYGSSFVTHGYCSSVSLPAQKCDGFARIQQQGGDTFTFNTLGPLKDGTGPKLGIPLQPKGIHDEANSTTFDPFGRMQASMGLEAPGATPILQNIILYPFVNPPTENLDTTGLPSSLNVTPISSSSDGTQIWKITHNGVDTHPLHFHLYNVQVLNRVTWDNNILPPDANELGWKETVRTSPLEDTYVAVRPIKPTLPFGVPDSKRLLNPAMPLNAQGDQAGPNGDQAGFNNTDANGNPINPIVNTVADFGWEYVWHCHMLSHEEMDMMRPQAVHTRRALPTAPVVSNTSATPDVKIGWTDGTPVDYAVPASWSAGSDPGTSEIGFRIERQSISNAGVVGAYAEVGTALANKTTFTDASATFGLRYRYRVTAFNAAGDSVSTPIVVGPALAAPGAPTIGSASPTNASAVVRWTPPVDAGGSAITGYTVRVVNATTSAQVGALRPAAAGATSLSVTGLTNGTGYKFQVLATNALGSSPYSALSNSATPVAPTKYTPRTPVRVLDTRTGTGAPAAKLGAGGTLTLTVPGLPAGTTAVAMNVTVTNATAPSFLSVYPNGQPQPVGSNLNFVAGQTIPNLVMVPLGPGNTLTFYNNAGTVDVLADLVGYNVSSGTSGFTGRNTPVRVLDTRTGTGAPAAKLGAGATLTLTVPGLPAGTTAVAMSVTAVNPTADSFMTVWPGGQARPAASSLNYTTGATISNLVVVPVGTGNTVSFYNAAGTVNVIADLVGQFTTGSNVGFTGWLPVRILDTRSGVGAPVAKVGAGATLILTVPDLPVGTTSVAMNVTVTNPTVAGHITVWPNGQPMPGTSSINYAPGQTISTMVLVPVGPGNTVSLNNSGGTVDLLSDIMGFYR